MTSAPYMPLYVADYLADTTHLTQAETGAYLLLLMAMWRSGGKLPNDDAKLAKFSRSTARGWAAMRATIMEFFTIENGFISQRRLSAELAKYQEFVNRQVKAGKASAQAKALKTNKPEATDVAARLNQPEPQPEQDRKREEPNGSLSLGSDAKAKISGELIATAVREYNAVAAKLSLPIAKSCTGSRTAAIRSRLGEDGIDGWRDALAGLDTKHCRGENDRGWRADLDFVASPKGFRKLRERCYGSKPTPANVVDLRPARMFTA